MFFDLLYRAQVARELSELLMVEAAHEQAAYQQSQWEWWSENGPDEEFPE